MICQVIQLRCKDSDNLVQGSIFFGALTFWTLDPFFPAPLAIHSYGAGSVSRLGLHFKILKRTRFFPHSLQLLLTHSISHNLDQFDGRYLIQHCDFWHYCLHYCVYTDPSLYILLNVQAPP